MSGGKVVLKGCSKFYYYGKGWQPILSVFVGLAYQEGKDIVFRFIIGYSSLMDFGP
jgi:hypothetical protein